VVGNRPSIYSLGPQLAASRVPTMIIVGEGDDYCAKVSAYMAETTPGAELVVVKNAGHLANLEQPEVFNAAVERFFRRGSGRAMMRSAEPAVPFQTARLRRAPCRGGASRGDDPPRPAERDERQPRDTF
jgi:hypothetical protein